MEKGPNKIRNILEAIEHVRKVPPSASLVERMQAMADDYIRKDMRISGFALWGIAASFIFMIVANFLVINSSGQQDFYARSGVGEQQELYDLIPVQSLYNE